MNMQIVFDIDRLVYNWIALRGNLRNRTIVYTCVLLDLFDQPRTQKPKEDLIDYLSSLPKRQALRSIRRLQITKYPDFDHEYNWQLLERNPPTPAEKVKITKQIMNMSKMHLLLELLKERLVESKNFDH